MPQPVMVTRCGPDTAQSQHSHSAVTAQSQHSRSTVAASGGHRIRRNEKGWNVTCCRIAAVTGSNAVSASGTPDKRYPRIQHAATPGSRRSDGKCTAIAAHSHSTRARARARAHPPTWIRGKVLGRRVLCREPVDPQHHRPAWHRDDSAVFGTPDHKAPVSARNGNVNPPQNMTQRIDAKI